MKNETIEVPEVAYRRLIEAWMRLKNTQEFLRDNGRRGPEVQAEMVKLREGSFHNAVVELDIFLNSVRMHQDELEKLVGIVVAS